MAHEKILIIADMVTAIDDDIEAAILQLLKVQPTVSVPRFDKRPAKAVLDKEN